MTKKILAALLVVIMVVSMFPATVFAASDCNLAAEAHSKAACDKAGFTYTKVASGTVEPKCGQNGYTMYECECGVRFLDDVIVMPEHKKASAKPATERVEPTCSEYGKAAFFACSECGELFPEYELGDITPDPKDNAPAGAIAKEEHTWNTPSCVEPEKVCTICGEKDKDFDEKFPHDIDYNNPHAIVKAPEYCVPGEATFKCKNPDCNYEKTVAVEAIGHTVNTLDWVAEVKSDCLKNKAGVKAHYECATCKAKFIVDDFGVLKAVAASELATKVEHTSVITLNVVEPSCVQAGYISKYCAACQSTPWIEDEIRNTGHTTLEEVLAHDADPKKVEEDGKWLLSTTERDCETGKTYTWNCQNLKCGSEEANVAYGYAADTICGEPITWEDESTAGHKEVRITVPATQKMPVRYTIALCSDPNCTLSDKSVEDKEIQGVTYTLDVSVRVVNNNVYDLRPDEDADLTFIEIVSAAKVNVVPGACSSHFYKENEGQYIAPTCTTAGAAFYVCETCFESVEETYAKLGHDYTFDALKWKQGESGLARPSTSSSSVNGKYSCTGTTYLYCSRGCSGSSAYSKKTGLGHIFNETPDIEAHKPSCLYSGGDVYFCLNCTTGIKVDNEVKANITNLYNSLEEAKKVHEVEGQYIYLTGEQYKSTNECVSATLTEYACDTCSTKFWVKDETTGRHWSDSAVFVEEEDADCENAAGWGEFVCDRCLVTVPAENKPVGHLMTKHEEVKATCTTAGNIEYYTCSRECCLEEVADIDPEKDGNQPGKLPKKYIYVEANDSYLAVSQEYTEVAAKNHDLDSKLQAPTCTTAGYTHVICKNECGLDYTTDFTEATGHKKATVLSTQKPDCDDNGMTYYACSNANCFGEDNKAETTDDNGKLNITIIPATGHKNQKGEKFENKCTDNTEDRVCTVCGGDFTNDAGHDYQETIVAPTCDKLGYKLYTCKNGCGDDKVSDYVKALGHKLPWGDMTEVDYVDFNKANLDDEEILKAYKKVISYTAPTFEKAGSITFKCEVCGEKKTMEVKVVGIDFTIEKDNAVVSGASTDALTEAFIPTDGEVIALTINMSAYNTNVWGVSFDFDYLAAGMKYLGYVYHAGESFGSLQINNKTTDHKTHKVGADGVTKIQNEYAKDCFGVISVAAYVEAGMDGTMTDVKVNGTQKLITLYFQLDSYLEYNIAGVDGVDYVNTYYQIKNVVATNEDGEFESQNGKREYLIIKPMMDTNNNGNFNIADLQNCIKILKGQADFEYIAGADANKDGIVNLVDLDLMNQKLVGKIAEPDVYKALAWTAPEGFVAG